MVSYIRARAEGLGFKCEVGFMQRAERMLLVGVGSIFDPALSSAGAWRDGTILQWIIAVIALGTVWTSVYRTVWISKALDNRKREAGS